MSGTREDNRGAQLARSLLILSQLADLRYGATLADIVEFVEGRALRRCCERTIRRDLILLERLGYVGRSDAERGYPVRWKLNPATPAVLWDSPRSKELAHVA